MKKRLGKNPAMMTVELGVSLVLIVVVLFVVIGLFNDNIKSMIGSSNFSRLFSANWKTFFQNFGRNYDDSQIYVQIMGEQGLQMLRQKANNNDEKLIDAAKLIGAGTNPQTANTILYLARVSRIIMNDNYICKTIKTPSTSLCVALDGIAYEVIDNGGTITIKGPSGNSLTTLNISKQVTLPTISSNATAKEKLAAIQQLAASYGASIDSSYAMTREITNFTTAMANASATNNIETELVNLLGSSTAAGTDSLYALLNSAKTTCPPVYDELVGGTVTPTTCASTVDSGDLASYDLLVSTIISQFRSLMNSTTYTGTPGSLNTSKIVYLPSTQLPPAYKPTINADDNWYSANAVAEPIVEGSEDALVMTLSKDDPLALLAPEGEEPVIVGSSDAIYQCTPDDSAECDFCATAGGIWSNTTGTCNCGPGEVFYLSGTNSACVTCASGILNGDGTCWVSSGGGSGGTGPTSCPSGQLLNDSVLPATCVTCSTVLDINGACCSTGILNSSGICTLQTSCTLSGSTISCTGDSPVIVSPSVTSPEITVSYVSAVSNTSTTCSSQVSSCSSAVFDGSFISGSNYMDDYYMSKLTGTDSSILAARVKVLTIYNDLFKTIIEKKLKRSDGTYWSVGRFLGEDTTGNACNRYRTIAMSIAKKHGLYNPVSTTSTVSDMYNYFKNTSNDVLCPTK